MAIVKWLVDKVLPTKLYKPNGEEFSFLLLFGVFLGVMLFVVYCGLAVLRIGAWRSATTIQILTCDVAFPSFPSTYLCDAGWILSRRRQISDRLGPGRKLGPSLAGALSVDPNPALAERGDALLPILHRQSNNGAGRN